MPTTFLILILLVLIALVGFLIWSFYRPKDSGPPRTLLKGESYLYCAITALIVAVAVWQTVHALSYSLAPKELRDQWAVSIALQIPSLLSGILAGLIIWVASSLPEIEIGWKGVPKFLGGRMHLFLFPEGKNKGLVGIIGVKVVDVRTQLMISEGKQSLHIPALARSTPKPVNTDPSLITKRRGDDNRQPYFVPITIIASVPYKVVDPNLWLNFEEANKRNMNKIIAAMREWTVAREMLDLPLQKDQATKLLASVTKTFEEVGVEALNVEILDFVLPPEINEAAVRISVEEIQAASEGRQGATLAAVAERLRAAFPRLDDEELRNMVLAGSKLATMTITSVETKGAAAILNVLGNKN